jgi:hypothetical protein
MALLCGLLIFAFLTRDYAKAPERYEETGMIELYTAWISEEAEDGVREQIYQIIQEDGESYLYVDGKRKGTVTYDGTSPVMQFDLNPEKASNEALKYEDNDTGTGKNVYHLKKSLAEKYLKYLQAAKGYTLVAYSEDATTWDGYLNGNDTLIRFLYIYSASDSGILLVGNMDENVNCPTSWEDFGVSGDAGK